MAPVTAALALVVLNMAQYYVGGELAGPVGQDDQKLNALQFGAKLHELLMLASLAAIVFTYIRRELVFGEGVPYGALCAGLELDNFSFLYSPELWSAAWAQWQRRRKRWMLLTLLICTTLLGVTLGPSTANLMRPRLDNWPAGGTKYWTSAAPGDILPDQMHATDSNSHCTTDSDDAACPHGDWRSLESQFHTYWPRLEPLGTMPETLMVSSPLSSRTIVVRRRSTEDTTRSIFSNAFTIASTQQSVVADGLAEVGRYWAYAAANDKGRQKFIYRKDAIFSTITPQPVVQARCEENVLGLVPVLRNLSFPIIAKPTCDGDSAACHVQPFEYTASANQSIIDQVVDLMTNTTEPTLVWWNDDSLKPENASAVAVATFPRTNNADSRLYRCTIDLRMANSTISSTRNLPKIVTGYAEEFKSVGTDNSSWPRVQISPDWAQLLNPTLLVENQTTTAFAHTAATAGMWNNGLKSYTYNYPFIIESILTLMVANGASRSTYSDSLVGTLKGEHDPSDPWAGGEWQKYMLPRHSLRFNGPQSIFIEPAPNDTSVSMFIMHARVTGYAWSTDGIIQKFNVTALLLYVVFAIVHMAYSWSTGVSSSAWDSVPEIIALAAQSQRSMHMQNTGAGIDTITPLKQKVRVRNVDGHLEYIFEDTYIKGSAVRPNRQYA